MTPQDIGEYIAVRFALPNAAATTAGTAVNGKNIDTRSLGARYHSASLVVPFNYKKAAATVVTMNAHLQTGHTTTSYVNLGSTSGYTATIAASSAASSGYSQFEAHIDLTMARRYLRARITPQSSVVSSVNFTNYSGVIVFGGGDQQPAS